uniref:helix-turn-helix transcriptional regulator n=1 Tax=Rubrimonas sp. TaxID=2036015 RepID=UPI002FDD1B6D
AAVLSGPICGMLGLDWRRVLDAAAVRPGKPGDGGFLVSAQEYVRLWTALMALSGRSDTTRLLGLRMASGPAIPVLFAMSSAPDFETGLERLARYKHLFGPMRFAITRTPAALSVRVEPDAPDIDLPASFSSPQIVYLHAVAMALSTRPFPPTGVSLPLPHTDREDLADVFGVTPAEGPPSLAYARADARIAFVSDNPALWRATEADLESHALIVSKSVPVAQRVRAALLEALPTGEPTLAHVCARLQMSRSTLLRRLRAEGATFQALLDATRAELALRYLRGSDLTNQQIAHLTGYRDPSAFQRAFRKWTGGTPQAARAAHLSRSSPSNGAG